jgi:hypothetical protein
MIDKAVSKIPLDTCISLKPIVGNWLTARCTQRSWSHIDIVGMKSSAMGRRLSSQGKHIRHHVLPFMMRETQFPMNTVVTLIICDR